MYKTTVNVEGMMCGMCESHVNDAIRNAFKVKKVKSDNGKKLTVIESDSPLDEAAVTKAITDTGYEVTGYSSEEVKKKGLFG